MTRWARLTWQVPDPALFAPALAARLDIAAQPGAALAPGAWTIDLGSARLEIRSWLRESAADHPLPGGRLVLEPVPGGEPTPEEEGGRDEVGEVGSGTGPRGLRLAGIGWATVELDRAADELGMWLGDAAAPDAIDPLLGARARVRAAGGLPGDTVLLLEPSTEGRLAASLARHGERETGLYVAPDGGFDEARRSGLTLGPTAGGPFGREALATDPGSLPGDSFLLIVEPPPATIGE
jgi:hypothetical protein